MIWEFGFAFLFGIGAMPKYVHGSGYMRAGAAHYLRTAGRPVRAIWLWVVQSMRHTSPGVHTRTRACQSTGKFTCPGISHVCLYGRVLRLPFAKAACGCNPISPTPLHDLVHYCIRSRLRAAPPLKIAQAKAADVPAAAAGRGGGLETNNPCSCAN